MQLQNKQGSRVKQYISISTLVLLSLIFFLPIFLHHVEGKKFKNILGKKLKSLQTGQLY